MNNKPNSAGDYAFWGFIVSFYAAPCIAYFLDPGWLVSAIFQAYVLPLYAGMAQSQLVLFAFHSLQYNEKRADRGFKAPLLTDHKPWRCYGTFLIVFVVSNYNIFIFDYFDFSQISVRALWVWSLLFSVTFFRLPTFFFPK